MNRVLDRVVRDLRAPMAALISADRTRVFAMHGFDDLESLKQLLATDPLLLRASDPDGLQVRGWARASIDEGAVSIASLFVADRRRRWFDNEELRHLSLLAQPAKALVLAEMPEPLDLVG